MKFYYVPACSDCGPPLAAHDRSLELDVTKGVLLFLAKSSKRLFWGSFGRPCEGPGDLVKALGSLGRAGGGPRKRYPGVLQDLSVLIFDFGFPFFVSKGLILRKIASGIIS